MYLVCFKVDGQFINVPANMVQDNLSAWKVFRRHVVHKGFVINNDFKPKKYGK